MQQLNDKQRILSAVTGSLLLYFVSRKHKVESLLLFGGAYLVYQAVAGRDQAMEEGEEIQGGSGRMNGHLSNINIKTHVVVTRPREQVYAAWKAKMPAMLGNNWDREVVKDELDAELSWRSAHGVLAETGKVNFSDTPGKATRVDMMISYRADLGEIGNRADRLLVPAFREKIENDIHDFKREMENQ